VLLVIDKHLHKILHSDGVYSWNNALGVRSFIGYGVNRDSILPGTPFFYFPIQVEAPIIDESFRREFVLIVFANKFANL